ncbi:hypothetical protein SUGI_0347620 [Cryptomeria japonica]|nr:hypothetical protein SUGI_0347620 [Cryptomeria japonica]
MSLIIPLFIGSGGKQAEIDRKLTKWVPPRKGWAKLNFDGASRGNPGIAGIGCAIHQDNGELIASINKPIGLASNNMAEFSALREGLIIAKSLKIKYLEIEGDSSLTINAVRTREVTNWKLKAEFKSILDLIKYFEETSVKHIYREGNSIADKLANLGADGNSYVFRKDSPMDYC